MSETGPLLSVVAPVHNEAEVIDGFLDRLTGVLEELGEPWEAILVDDGSTDGSRDRIQARCAADPRIRLLGLSRRFGNQVALTAGIDFAAGDAVAVIDADLQIPPEIIPRLVARWREGFDLVYAVRESREDSLARRLVSTLFFRLLLWRSETPIPPDTTECRLMGPPVVRAYRRLRERNRFFRGLSHWVGFKQAGVPFTSLERQAGRSKFSPGRLIKLAFDAATSFSSVPLRLALVLGIVSMAFSFLLLGDVVVSTLILHRSISGWASLMTALAFFGGTQLVVLGLLGEYVSRIFQEVKGRPLYIVETQVGLDGRIGGEEEIRG